MKTLLALTLPFVLAFAAGRFSAEASPPTASPASGPLPNSGCCSWHRGVCGCSGGRVQCCDYTLSPSCRCN